MNVTNVIRKLKVMLGAQFNFAEATLVDGTQVYSEGEFVPGAILFVRAGEGVSEDPFAPEGKHETSDGKIISVGANGEITEVSTVAEEAPEVAEEAMEDVTLPVDVAPEAIVATQDLLAGIAELIAPFTEEIAVLKEEVVALSQRFEKMAAEPAASKVKNTFAEVLADKNSKSDARLTQLAALRKSIIK